MTHIIETCAAAIMAGWLLHRFIAIGLPRSAPKHWSLLGGYGAAAVAAYIAGVGFGVWVSVMAPVGAMVPLLCLASSARVMGWWSPPTLPRVDALVLALLVLVVLVGAAGIGPLNAYAWFYAGIGPAALAAGLALWALWRGQVVILAGLVLGQVLWLTDIGSSNLYDQFSHFFLLPALVLTGLGASFEGFRRLIRL